MNQVEKRNFGDNRKPSQAKTSATTKRTSVKTTVKDSKVLTPVRSQKEPMTSPPQDFKFGQGKKKKKRRRKHRHRLRSGAGTKPVTATTGNASVQATTVLGTGTNDDGQFDIFRDSLEDFSKLFPWEEVESETFTSLTGLLV